MPLELALAVLLTTATPAPATDGAETLTVMVSRVEGQVTAISAAGQSAELHARQVIAGDWNVEQVPQGGELQLLCSTERRAHVEGPARRLSVTTLCEDGTELSPGTYRMVTFDRLELTTVRVEGTIRPILDSPHRGSDEGDPLVPTLLAPRSTDLRESRPSIQWTQVHGATRYVIELSGESPWTIELSAREVPCEVTAYPPSRAYVCSIPWPDEKPGLLPSETAYLRIGAKTSPVTPLRAGDKHPLRRIAATEAAGVEQGLMDLADLVPCPAERALREAVWLADHDLLGEAAATLRTSLAGRPTADGYLLLGSLDIGRGLPRAAIRSFEEATQLSADAPQTHRERITESAREGIEAARQLLIEDR